MSAARAVTWPLGLLALGGFAIHGGGHLFRGTAHDVLWACTMANLLIGIGLIFPQRTQRVRLVAVGVLWLLVGNFTWAVDLILGGDFFYSSLLTHVGGLVLGGLGLHRLGYPSRAWIFATAGMVLLQLLCRVVTPPAANVNVAHQVYGFYRGIYGSYLQFWVASFFQTALAYFVLDWLLTRIYRRLARSRSPGARAGDVVVA